MRAVGPDALREWLLLLGFVLIVAAGVLTVAIPELSKEPDGELGTAHDTAAAHETAPHPK